MNEKAEREGERQHQVDARGSEEQDVDETKVDKRMPNKTKHKDERERRERHVHQNTTHTHVHP